MIIVELCGLPGAGKSTLIKEYTKHVSNFKIYTRSSLHSKNRILNYSQMKLRLWACKHSLYRYPSSIFDEVFASFPDASVHAKVRLMDLYKRINKIHLEDGYLILEEGPIQYFTSLSYTKAINETESFNTYWKLYEGYNYYPVYCDCEIDTCIERIRGRKKASAFYDPDDKDINSLLEIKRHNIIHSLSQLNPDYNVVSMNHDLDYSVKEFSSIMNGIV